MEILTTTALAHAASEEKEHVCDLCHKRHGVGFIDGFWACAACAGQYAQQLEGERWRR